MNRFYSVKGKGCFNYFFLNLCEYTSHILLLLHNYLAQKQIYILWKHSLPFINHHRSHTQSFTVCFGTSSPLCSYKRTIAKENYDMASLQAAAEIGCAFVFRFQMLTVAWNFYERLQQNKNGIGISLGVFEDRPISWYFTGDKLLIF